MNLISKLMISLGSLASIVFGVWHFFVPRAWNWYSYMDANASELAVAVRAINVFFSLSLVLFGLINILFVFGDHANRYSMLVVLAATCLLWLTRFIFQIVFPQGSMNPWLQYGMLIAFAVILICYFVPFLILAFQKGAS